LELSDGHEMQWAKRHVCGYCSLEQPIAARCTGCSRKLAATAQNPKGVLLRALCLHCSQHRSSAQAATRALLSTPLLRAGRQMRHWEGGRGTRDKAHMDGRDKHKYMSKAKTKSKRAAKREGIT